jgi:hypothetical protein
MREKKPENFLVVGVALPIAIVIVSTALARGDAVSAGVGFGLADLIWLSLAFKYPGGKRLFSVCCFLLLTAALLWLRPSGLPSNQANVSRSVSSAPVPSPRPFVPQARPRPDDGALVPALNDRNVLHYAKAVIAYGFLGGLALFFLWRGVREFRNEGEWTAFFPVLIVAVILGGGWSWVHYFAGHGAFLIWPIVVAVAVLALALLRAVVVDRQNRERAEELREMPPPPDTGGGPAKKSDFKDW